MSCTLGRSGLGQQTVALCSISRCRVTGAQSLLKTTMKPFQYCRSWKKKNRRISELDLILQFFWYKRTFFSFSNTNQRETRDECLLGKVVFCFSIQCTFPQIRTTLNEKNCTCPIVVFVHRTPRICSKCSLGRQYAISVLNLFEKTTLQKTFYIH